jgi:hypothetical protein
VGKLGLSFQKEIEIEDLNVNPTKAKVSEVNNITLFWEEFPEFSLTVALIQQID